MKRLIAISAAAFTALGCASHGVMVSEQQLSQFERGKTTEQEVLSALGRPTAVTTHNGQRMIVYSGANVQTRAASFIPLVGPLVGGADVQASSVVFRISNGVVTDITSTQSASGTGVGLAAEHSGGER